MCALSTDRVLGVSLLASDMPRDYGALVDAIIDFYSQLDLAPRWFSVLGRTSWGRIRKFKPKLFRNSVLDEQAMMVHLGPEEGATEHVIQCFLRPRDPNKQDFVTRWVTLTGTGLTFELTAVRTFVTRIIELYPVVHGGVAGYRSLGYAAKECSFSGAVDTSEVDEATRRRLGEDQMLSGRMLRSIRRLYPITIIGAHAWSQLPPMPALDPMPVVEAVGDCKLIHAWPRLVEPRDPEFLAGTTELRRWLWPYTIQNPADAIEPENT